ncbi:MAG: hypothetical protein LBE05_01180 [Microbacterium sp.]|nr:hypothetical protein [Microbacterium sp.]
MTKYDDASWHYGGIYPADLPDEAAATHIGVFVAWCLLNGYLDDEAAEDFADELEDLRARSITPGRFLLHVMDEKFVSSDLSEGGNAFTIAYYQGSEGDSRYIDDFVAAFDTDTTDIYRVPDTWDVFDRIAERIAARHAAWLDSGRPRFIV